MAKKVSNGPNRLVLAGVGAIVLAIGAVTAVFVLFPKPGLPDTAKIDTCLPGSVTSVLANSEAVSRNPGDVVVYLDVSGGMAGYVAGRPNVIGNFTTIAQTYAQSGYYADGRKGKVTFRTFGEYSFDPAAPMAPAAAADIDALALPATYGEQDSRIADLLQWIKHDRSTGAAPLSVIVTDLMLDDPEAVARFEALVGGQLRTMINEDDLSLGIMAVRVPFVGKVYFGTTGIEAAVRDRPLVFLMIGEPYQVRSFYDYLGTTETAPFDSDVDADYRAFALLGLKAGSIVLAKPELTKPSRAFSLVPAQLRVPGADKITSVRFKASANDDKQGMRFELVADAGVAPYEVIGSKPVYEASVWKLDRAALTPKNCKADTVWRNMGNLPSSGWKVSGQKVTYTLTAAEMQQAGLDKEGLYMVQVVAGQQGKVVDHPKAAWMSDWSMDNGTIVERLSASRSAARLGVPGLEPLRGILLAELTIPESEKIRRTASQLIIEVE